MNTKEKKRRAITEASPDEAMCLTYWRLHNRSHMRLLG